MKQLIDERCNKDAEDQIADEEIRRQVQEKIDLIKDSLSAEQRRNRWAAYALGYMVIAISVQVSRWICILFTVNKS